jgi:hypothetical protein
MKRIVVISSALTGLTVVALATALICGPLAFNAHRATPSHATASAAAAGTPHVADRYNGRKAAPKARISNLVYLGGAVETIPAIYIDWWGPQWASGFSTGGYTSAQAQTYMQDFYTNIGGTSWENIVTQYCQGVAVGMVNCGSSGTHIQNLTGQLKGIWNDTTTVPTSPSQTDINNAALRASRHFGYSANATYFVFTPTGHSQSGFAGVGGSWCAYHSAVGSTSGNVAYAYMPYLPDAGASCGMNSVNLSDNSYGNGYFDDFSVVGGHEYAEAETDPFTQGYAWLDRGGNEIGDKCAWSFLSTDITLSNGLFYAVQPLWSNASSRCVTTF